MNDIFSPIEALRFGWYTLKKNIIFFLVLMVIVAVLYAFPFMIGMIFPPLYDNLSQAPISGPTIILIIVVTIAAVAINITVEMGLLKIALSFRDNIMPEVKDLFRSYPLILNYLAASIIYALMVLGGFALLAAGNFFLGSGGGVGQIILSLGLLLLAIYLALKYQFYGYLIVDKEMGPIEALLQSDRLTACALKPLLIFWLLLYGLMIIIYIVLNVLFALPIGILAFSEFKSLFAIFAAAIFAAAINFISFTIKLLIIVPITKLSTAYIYRALEEHHMSSASEEVEPEVDEMMD
jgi:uncharacterized membrane protein